MLTNGISRLIQIEGAFFIKIYQRAYAFDKVIFFEKIVVCIDRRSKAVGHMDICI